MCFWKQVYTQPSNGIGIRKPSTCGWRGLSHPSHLDRGGSHTVDIRNRAEHNKTSTGFRLRFKQLEVLSTVYDEHTIEYAYDNLSRLREARYNPGTNVDAIDADLLRWYKYSFDLTGNRRTEEVWVNNSLITDITYDYNGANQLIDDGTYTYEYDANGNLRYKKLTGTPVEEYIWNRANRLVTWDNGTAADLLNYSYDGLNNRISRSLGTTSPTVTKYLLDLQPGLSVVLAATEDTDVTRYVHGPMGIHAQEDPAGAWSWMVQDGLGSVRGVVDNSVAVDEVRLNDPFGNQVISSPYDYAATVYGFTGELTETVNPLVHLRARDYNPALGVFPSLDPFEGKTCDPMSLNGYSFVTGNPINMVDPSGMFGVSSLIGFVGTSSMPAILSGGLCFGLSLISDRCDICLQTGILGDSGTGYMECLETCERLNRQDALRIYADRLYNCLPEHGIYWELNAPIVRRTDNGDCTLTDRPTDSVNALARLIRYGGASFPEISTTQLMDEISAVLIESTGPTTILTEGRYNPENRDHPLTTLMTGFAASYTSGLQGRDDAHQINHFWAFFNTEVQGGRFWVERADIEHECVHETAKTWDARLSTVAARLGSRAASWSPNQVAQAIENTLKTDFTGYLLSHYYTSPACRHIAVLDLAERGMPWPERVSLYTFGVPEVPDPVMP